MTTGGNINTISIGTSDVIRNFVDGFFTSQVTLTVPANKSTININAINGYAGAIPFSWPSLSLAVGTNYNLIVALDAGFSQQIINTTVTNGLILPTVTSVQAGSNFFPGTTYYWEVCASSPVTSLYSAAGSFTIQSSQNFALVSPANGAYNVPVNPLYTWTAAPGAVSYQISLAEDPTFTILTLEPYFYQPVLPGYGFSQEQRHLLRESPWRNG